MRKYIFITICIIIFLSNVSNILFSVKDACILFFNKIFISIFPFMILSDILFYYDYHVFIKNSFIGKFISKVFNIDYACSTVFIFSIFTSQPNNSIYIKNMLDKKYIDVESANRLLCFTYFPSIFFVIGTVGILLFNDIKIGILLYLNCLFNNLIIGIFLRKKLIISNNDFSENKDTLLNTIKNSIIKSFNNCYIILGNLIIFSILINIFKNIFNLDGILLCVLSSFFELTNSLYNISTIDLDFHLKLFLSSFTLCFSGLSILFQSFSILGDYNINIKKILIIKLIFSLLSSIILLLFFPILP